MKFSLAIITLLPLVSAHFTLDYPESRGFDEDIEPQFCGGFANPSSIRQPFPLSGPAPLLIDSHHNTAQVAVLAAIGYTNVTSFADFNKTATGENVGLLMNFGTIQGQGEFCFNVNFASLGVSIPNGTLATIQVEFNGGDGLLLQCADVILVTNYTVPSNVTCTNATETTTTPTTNTTSSSGGGTTTSSGPTGSPTTRASGATSNGVGIAAFVVVVAAAFGLIV